jgi:hypothetical protein
MNKLNRPFLLALGTVAFYCSSAFAQTVAPEEKAPETKFKKSAITAKIDNASLVDADEFKKLGLGLIFTGNKLQITGNLADQCSAQLNIEVKKLQPSDQSDSKAENEEGLIAQANHYGARITFSGSAEVKTLSDCVNFDLNAPKSELSSNSKLSRELLVDHEIAVAGLLDSSNNVLLEKDFARSDEYKRASKLIASVDCKSCNSNTDSLRSRINELKSMDSKLVGSLLPKLLEASIAQIEDRISKAKNMGELEKILADLSDLAESVPGLKISADDKGAQLSLIADQFNGLVAKNRSLAYELKSEKERTRSADFMVKAHEQLSKLPGIDEDSKDEALKIAASYKKNGDQRLDFLSEIDPNHHEVIEGMKKADLSLTKLQRDAQNACKGSANRYNFSRCTDAMNKYQSLSQHQKLIKDRFQAAQQMNSMMVQPSTQNPMLSTWFAANMSASAAPTTVTNAPNNQPFVLNPAVMPGATAYNQSVDLDARNVFANNLVYNQAYNNPYMQNGRMSLQTSNLPTAIAIPGVSDLPVPAAAAAKKVTGPTFSFSS